MLLSRSIGPFVLLDDARPGASAPARLLRDPVEIVAAVTPGEIEAALETLRGARARGLHAGGYLAYEAGYALEPRLMALDTRRRESDPPLLWFGLFERIEEIAPADIADLLGAPSPAASPAEPLIDRAAYEAAFAQARQHIVEGDIYQVNLTFTCSVDTGEDPVASYAAIRSRAAAGHGGLLFTGDHWLLSFSPEMFFTLEGGRLVTRPMKGTALRDADPARDVANADALREDAKQRAENLMIVDLLRNDMSRVARAGSVEVPDLFTIESYPTVHQMTSTVEARLREGLDAVDVLRALFPCGSITGAPKIRAMEIIHALEPHARGPYTGSIGLIDRAGNAAFNVAIRTICVKDGARQGTIGLGSGLVFDSTAANEWNECLDKGRFLASGAGGKAGDGDGD